MTRKDKHHAVRSSRGCLGFTVLLWFLVYAGSVKISPAVDQRPDAQALAWPEITRQQRPWAFWWWMGSAVDKTNITREIERYHAAGLGGVHIIPIYGAKGWEDKYINYLSPQWMEMMGWSVSEAKRLGLGVDMTTGSGWCFGGPQVSDEEANANVVVKTFDLKAGETLKEKFNRASTQALVAFAPDGKSVELTDKISADGEVDWTAPASSLDPSGRAGQSAGAAWTVYAISQKPSGQKVKRPGPGGEGWMLNLIYPLAMDDFLKPYTAAFANYHGPKPRAQYHDSYEYRSDWSPVFFAEFEKRRGYRLQTELPALFSKNPDDHAARVLCDYRQTVSEIIAEESLPKWTQWSHDHGFLTRNQAHGSPGNWLDLYAVADIPETEMFHTDRNKLISKFASSAAHVTGKPLVSSETGTWLNEHFTETLADMKYLLDDLFLSGVNHVFYHGTCYSPDEAGWPGWLFYASFQMNPRNSVWRDVPALNAYAAHCQSVLQSGQPDNDILLYWPIEDFWMQPGDKLLPQLTVHARDWFEGQPIGRTAKELWDKGYSFDYVSDAQLKTAKVVNGKLPNLVGELSDTKLIQMPGGRYKVIVVPKCKFMPLETFKQLLALAENGATVIFEEQLPTDVSGAGAFQKRSEDFKESLKRIRFGRYHTMTLSVLAVGNEASFGTGEIIESTVISALIQANVHPELLTDAGLSFSRRSFDGGWNYFIANRGTTNFDGWIALARHAKSVVHLEPTTGKSGVAESRKNEFGATEVHLQLAAGESVILRAFADIKVEGPAWNYWPTNDQPVEITGPWNVKFILGGPTLPADFQTAKLASWTTFPDTNTQAFAGTALYTIKFDAPPAKTENWLLDLGQVRQSARVRLNGRDLGTLLTSPFRVMVNGLKPKGNLLEVEVTNVSANRIRDLDRRGVKWRNFNDINFVNINYKPFDASNWPLTDSGLLGPVTLAAAKEVTP